ncbi:MAG: hypothetical protein ABSA43_02405 [Candidatus Microgenomates bacterium]|jgi:hypothetical protein
MSNEEKRNLKLNCYSDFQRSAITYVQNPFGKSHLTFFNHGEKLLNELGDEKLLGECKLIRSKILKSRRFNINLADKILTVGILASQG